MDSGFGRGIGESLVMGVFLLALCAFVLGLLAMWGLPKLWMFIKPIIHTITT